MSGLVRLKVCRSVGLSVCLSAKNSLVTHVVQQRLLLLVVVVVVVVECKFIGRLADRDAGPGMPKRETDGAAGSVSVDGDLGVVSASAKVNLARWLPMTSPVVERAGGCSCRSVWETEREERSPGQGRTGH
ncbi:hypothetical protein K456DRAFT_737843 [Colletotrichum gloeosporioides 23]|nr:hypothetical protein K456DRAFT_737843 [Colletotrichum gloeosporioides 23]